MDITGILSALIIGLVIGVLAKLIVPGRQKTPIWLTILVGIVAAFIGTAIARAIGVENTAGIDWIEVIIQIGIAAVGVALVAGTRRRKSIL
jgi:uncharacterized membrane protein YeaQ/YmgE (transglycosylase-associated protein family)